MRNVVIPGLVVLGFGLACSFTGGEGDLATPECCLTQIEGDTVYEMTDHASCDASGGTWVAEAGCEVVCCDAGSPFYTTRNECARMSGSPVDAASHCGE